MDLRTKLKGKKNKAQLKELIGNYLLDAIFSDTSQSKSPVTGNRFVPLQSKSYKRIKKKKRGHSRADLRLFEKMLPSLKVKNTVAGIKIEITKDKEMKKAHNHNLGVTVPARPFLPNDGDGTPVVPKKLGGDVFRKSIMDGIDDLLSGE